MSLTKEQAVKEIIKCGKNSTYFVNNFCRISHPVHGLIRFNTYDFQEFHIYDITCIYGIEGNVSPESI